MALPHPLILKFILKNNTDRTLLMKHHVPWLHSRILNIYHRGNTEKGTLDLAYAQILVVYKYIRN